MSKSVKIAVVGLGGRGRGLLERSIIPACKEYGMEVKAVLDQYEDRTAAGADIVEGATGKRPRACKDRSEILTDPEIKAVIIATSWEQHIGLAIEVMKSGKYAAVEVGGAYALEDVWRLVYTSEETGMHCMLLENCCYGKRELMVLNMVRKGLFGKIVHCEGGYYHDLREEIVSGWEAKHYRLRNYIHRNCENYPTHELGPIGKLLNINNGNRMLSLTSTSSASFGLHEYVRERKDSSDALRSVRFSQGDVVTTVITCANGQTITITLDTSLPHVYSRGFTVCGTKGRYTEGTDSIYLDGTHNELEMKPQEFYNNAQAYEEDYMHDLWRDYAPKGGHGGMDYLVISAFLEAVKKGVKPPIDTYDTATYMAISVLSEESILKGSAPVAIPDFTRGKWYMRDDIDFDLAFNLDQPSQYGELYF